MFIYLLTWTTVSPTCVCDCMRVGAGNSVHSCSQRTEFVPHGLVVHGGGKSDTQADTEPMCRVRKQRELMPLQMRHTSSKGHNNRDFKSPGHVYEQGQV